MTDTDKKAESRRQYNAGHGCFHAGHECPKDASEAFKFGFIDAKGESEEEPDDSDAIFWALNDGQDYR